ncbi:MULTISPECIES: GNAT family N-acetyltransferase [Dyadobacter]|uniref:GNAT family N-acetyltransferase n=1 Tax=Dyadobacter chenhuakuii TaxID=2909339 RepID=A0A9X1U124_9BACT|nr:MULTISPECIES: GNAT family N-acetyltransferase [Dyadobacter]MCF2498881.1 GNAT family N-acetyltransferase [Dyadobacter chenhuakuii]MCF2517810.1 GNAT family N-acetyltransferase [Dyadobacter sp. CY351]
MQFQILPLSENDFTEVTSVWEASVRASHHFLSEADIQFYKPLILKEYLPILSLFGIRAASRGIAGFIGVAERRIEMLFVHPDDFGKGIGQALCRFAVQELGAWEVDVNEDNKEALKFYIKMGFKIVGRSPLDPSGKPFPILHLKANDRLSFYFVN